MARRVERFDVRWRVELRRRVELEWFVVGWRVESAAVRRVADRAQAAHRARVVRVEQGGASSRAVRPVRSAQAASSSGSTRRRVEQWWCVEFEWFVGYVGLRCRRAAAAPVAGVEQWWCVEFEWSGASGTTRRAVAPSVVRRASAATAATAPLEDTSLHGGPAEGEPSAGARLGLQERLESGRAGRWLISAFLVVTVGGIVIANLPAGPVQRRLAKVTQPYMNVTTLYQRWNMYAPYPRKEILYLEARVVHADGRVTVWRTPADGPVFGPYRDSHWRKYIEHALARPGNPDEWPQLWEPLARYIAAQEADNGVEPVSVTLMKRSALNLPPDGSGLDRTPFETIDYYTLRLR